MDRRVFVGALTLGLLAAPLLAEAQQGGKVYHIGLLGGSPPNSPGGRLAWEGFFQGMGELGYVEGQNILVEGRWYGDRTDRLPALAAELVRLKVDVIVAGAPPLPRRPSAPRRRSPSSRRITTIRSVVGSQSALRNRGRTLRDYPLSRQSWPASGCNCSRR